MADRFLLVSVGIIVVGIAGLSAFASLVRAWQRRQPDPAWQAQTPVQKFTGYDQEKAVASKHRALELEKSKRRLAASRSEPRIVDTRKIVRLDKKRAR